MPSEAPAPASASVPVSGPAPRPPARSARRFTIDGSDALEDHLAEICQRVVEGLRRVLAPRALEAVLLGGGYGRGEGGVLRTEAGDQPYNDLEFYVFVRGNRLLHECRHGAALHALAAQLAIGAGVEIEFKLVTRRQLRRSPVSMFYYDLVSGHRRAFGDEGVLAGCAHHRNAERIPLAEATRLLMNRATGLLLARERCRRDRFTAADADFAGRNLAKAQLAFGDAVLAGFGRYHWSCREREERLQRLAVDQPWFPQVRAHHARGVAFKLRPQRSGLPREGFAELLDELTALGLQVWLWLESQRLACPLDSARSYALSRLNKCPETAGWRNRLVNLKAFGPPGLWRAGAGRHPRERILQALVLLLWEPRTAVDPVLLEAVQRDLGTKATTAPELVRAYESLWRRFN